MLELVVVIGLGISDSLLDRGKRVGYHQWAKKEKEGVQEE